jgi:hypothetical protein
MNKDKMNLTKKHTKRFDGIRLVIILCTIAQVSFAQHSNFIHIDQFGYQTNSTKAAVISNPEIGFNSNLSYSIGNVIQLIDAFTDQVVYSGNPVPWNNGGIHSQSGDRGWWFDFSSFSTPGIYYIHDPANNESSATFEIGDAVYDDLLVAASKMFYYNRCYSEKSTPYVFPGYTDEINFPQDEFTRDVYDQSNTSTVKDMRGGWFDAGDNNKYVTFAESAVHDLLWAYRSNPNLFTDNFNIPESGNGLPDLIDEIKWETDWLLKMTNSDGSVHIKMGNRNFIENVLAPPSVNTDTRYYGPICTSSAIANASMLAHTSSVFSQFPSLTTYAQELENIAILCWNWVLPFLNSGNLDINCDDGSVVAGDADRTSEEQRKMALAAAVYLFELTGDEQYNQYVIQNINDTEIIANDQWDNYNISTIDALLLYTTIPSADPATISIILNSAQNALSNNYNYYFKFNELDLYRAYSNNWTYHWGSNLSKANMANLNFIFSKYNILPADNGSLNLRASEMLHYYHGVNPLNIVYLSNMESYGAENSLKEIYHFWYHDGSIWDNSETSTYGPAPGYLSGGCNQYYDANTNLTPPYDQPLQKSYLDFNNDFPDNSWELSEPAIYYQAAYVRLLSNTINLHEPVLSTDDFNEFENRYAFIYPNPTSNSVYIKSSKPIISIHIYNMSGHLTKMYRSELNSTEIDMTTFPDGLYLIKINEEITYRLIKK